MHTSSGTPISLYDGLRGYINRSSASDLQDKGFSRVYVWDGAQSPASSWLTGANPPQSALQNGSAQQADINTQVDTLCSQYIHPATETLLVLDVEWPLFKERPAISLGGSYTAYSVNALNAGNLVRVLSWIRAEFARTPCATAVRLGAYQVTFSAPPLFAGYDYNVRSASSWRAFNQQLAGMFAPYVDALMPSLYASWSPDQTDAYILNWQKVATETLSEASTAALSNKLGLIPFIGLRYYNDARIRHGVCMSGSYQGRFVDASFFSKMLQLITQRFSADGIVYWDWGGYGGPTVKDVSGNAVTCTANDGSNVWSTSAPWYVTTFSLFVARVNHRRGN
jgi:hypothetical protein